MSRSRRVAVLCAALFVACVALAAGAAEAAGVLLPRDGSAPIRVRSHRVTTVIDDGLARTTVRQTFVNPHGRSLEAVFVFPVPERAAVVGLAMEAGGQRLEGLLAERRAARRAYDAITRRNLDPALLEQIGRTTFRLSVFPVLPDAPTVVEVTWIETVPLSQGEVRWVYPLELGGDPAVTEQDFTLDVTIRSSARLVAVSSPEPGMAVRLSPHEARASFERTAAPLDHDVEVVARVAEPEPSLAVRTFRGATGDAWFAAVVTPPAVDEDEILPRDVTLVLDVSGSMEGTKLEQAKASARWLLDHARPRDRVNVIRFASVPDPAADAPLDATPANVARLRAFVDASVAAGGTALGDVLGVACAAPVAPGRVPAVVLLTDGEPTIGETSPAAIVEFARAGAERGLRIFTFGVGDDVNASLLDGIAAAGRGTSETFRAHGEIEGRLRAFLARTASPVLADLRLEIDGRPVADLQPRPLADVHLGEQAVLTGRVAATGSCDVVVRGLFRGRQIVLTTKAEFPAEPGGAAAVRDLHAHATLAFLQRALRLRSGLSDDAYFAALDRGAYSTGDELAKAILDLSLESGVQSPYTSFIALLPEDRARLDPRDAEALDAAIRRASARRRETAGLPGIEESRRPDADPVRVDAKDSDHDVTADDEPEYPTLADPEFFGDAAFEAAGTIDTSGDGDFESRGTAGGAFGGRLSPAAAGRTASERAVRVADDWFVRSSLPTGGWPADADEHLTPTDATLDPTTTGLVLLVYADAGESHQQGPHRAMLRDALRALRNVQDSDGCFGPRRGDAWRRGHVVATLGVVEMYGFTQSVVLRDAAARGVAFAQSMLAAAEPRPTDDRAAIQEAAWLVLLGDAARRASIDVDAAVWAKAVARLERSPSAPQLAPDDEALRLAARTLARSLESDTSSDRSALRTEFDRLRALASADPDLAAAEPFLWFATLAAHRVGGTAWASWSRTHVEPVVTARISDPASPLRGTWTPAKQGIASSRLRCAALRTLEMALLHRDHPGIGRR